MLRDCSKYIYLLLAAATVIGCSTQKNTSGTRSFHATKVRYNIYYNGGLSYDEGIKAINAAVKDDYTSVIPLYPISDHEAASAAKSQMDRTIEKSRKAIKLHSIKVKPKADPKRRQDPKYKQWLKQEEFNPQIPNAWLRLGEAEFHSGDFIGSIGTFGYIREHFTYDANVVAQCQLYIARAYAEMGWDYEAEEMLRQVNPDDLARRKAYLYSAATADVLIHQGRYREALPHLKQAYPYQKRKEYKGRFAFVMAQIEQKLGMRDEAIDAYRQVLNLTPGETMEFHSKLNLAMLRGKSKSLERMLAEDKNKDRRDAIYAAMAQIQMAQHDTLGALACYQLAIDSGNTQSVNILLTAADLYFGQKNYTAAQPCYAKALTFMQPEAENYKEISRRSEYLEELVAQINIVTLQDSLQHLATLSDDSLIAVLTRQVEAERLAQQQEEERAQQAERQAQLDAEGQTSVNTQGMIGGGTASQGWYFYNRQLIAQGKSAFLRKWGSRSLQDNWRRSSADSPVSPDESSESEASAESTEEAKNTDETVSKTAEDEMLSQLDSQVADYYKQVPRTPEAIAASDTLIANALYSEIYIYRDKLQDEPMAVETLSELRTRFPNEGRLSEIDRENALRERVKTDPAFVAQELARLRADDSLYTAIYASYARADYKKVIRLTDTVAEGSPNAARALFVRAIAIGKTQKQQQFGEALEHLIARCPDSEYSSMARDFIAMMGDGYTSKQSKRTVGLDEARQESIDNAALAEAEQEQEQAPKNIVMLTLTRGGDANTILYQMALFNFSQFMIRDFDLSASEKQVIVSGFESQEDVRWYIGLIEKDASLSQQLRAAGVEIEAK